MATGFLELDDAEKAAFAGNCIALSERDVWMSAAAAQALTPQHRTDLAAWGFAVQSVPLDEIEKAAAPCAAASPKSTEKPAAVVEP